MTIDEAIKHSEEVAERYEKMEDSHDDKLKQECLQCAADHRQLAEWLTELKEAKRLLRLAIEDINAAEACDTCEYYPVINSDMCQRDDCYKWRYADEALKLIGGNENG